MKTFLTVLITILQFFIVVIPFKGEIFLKLNKFPKNITKLGYALFFCCITTATLTIIQFILNNQDQIIAERKAEKEKAIKESAFKALQLSIKDSIKNAIENSYTKSLTSSNEALAKYSLAFSDSFNSVKRIINTIKTNSTNPQLAVCAASIGTQPIYLQKGITEDTLFFQIESHGGTSYNIVVEYYVLNGSVNEFKILKTEQIPLNFLTDNRFSTIFTLIPFTANFSSYSELLIFLTGSFSKDPDNKLKVQYNECFSFDFKNNKMLGKYPILDMNEFKEYIKTLPLPN
jgi:hypothetical protein